MQREQRTEEEAQLVYKRDYKAIGLTREPMFYFASKRKRGSSITQWQEHSGCKGVLLHHLAPEINSD